MSNTFKGTPGRWQFKPYCNGSSILHVQDYTFGEIYFNPSMKDGEFEANAQLIEHAPAMLEMLQ